MKKALFSKNELQIGDVILTAIGCEYRVKAYWPSGLLKVSNIDDPWDDTTAVRVEGVVGVTRDGIEDRRGDINPVAIELKQMGFKSNNNNDVSVHETLRITSYKVPRVHWELVVKAIKEDAMKGNCQISKIFVNGEVVFNNVSKGTARCYVLAHATGLGNERHAYNYKPDPAEKLYTITINNTGQGPLSEFWYKETVLFSPGKMF